MNAPVTHHREHSFLLLVAAIVFFAVHSVSRDTDFGLIAAGLAAFAAAFVPL
jgi:hypothetical protein